MSRELADAIGRVLPRSASSGIPDLRFYEPGRGCYTMEVLEIASAAVGLPTAPVALPLFWKPNLCRLFHNLINSSNSRRAYLSLQNHYVVLIPRDDGAFVVLDSKPPHETVRTTEELCDLMPSAARLVCATQSDLDVSAKWNTAAIEWSKRKASLQSAMGLLTPAEAEVTIDQTATFLSRYPGFDVTDLVFAAPNPAEAEKTLEREEIPTQVLHEEIPAAPPPGEIVAELSALRQANALLIVGQDPYDGAISVTPTRSQ